jgi:hypothetical protein
LIEHNACPSSCDAWGREVAVAQRKIAARTTAKDGDLACDWRFDQQPEPGKDVSVHVNGAAVGVGDGTCLGVDCYFSSDGGLTARKRNAVSRSDSLHWNGSAAGYELAPTDELTIAFEIAQLMAAPLSTWRRILANDSLMVVLASGVALGALIQSCVTGEPSWFARAGALLVAIGINVVARTTITGVDPRPNVMSDDSGTYIRLPEHYHALREPVPSWVIEDQHTRRAIGVIGPIISLVGTLIWAYGDVALCRLVSSLRCAAVP